MRIAIFTETFLPKIDGVVSILCQALEHLQERGHQVILFGPPDMPASYAGARCIPTGGPRFPLYPELRMNLPWPRIGRELRRFAPDVVHVVNPAFLGPTGIALARRLRLPLVASCHMDIPTYTRLYVGAWGIPIAWWLFRSVHNIADLNLVPSTAMRDQVRANGYRRVRWWHRGIDTQRFRPELRSMAMRERLSGGAPDQFLALYVGRISREKNVHLLRERVATLPGVRLALVGGGPELAQMQRLFAGTATTFTGFLRGDDVVAAYASADVLVFPSTSETFGLAPLEAMACGLPVIGSMSGGLVDTLRDGENALVYDEDQPGGLAECLQQLRADPELHARLRAGAIAYARGRDWQATMDQLIDYYDLAIRIHRRHHHTSR
ncbi:MAG TPA: glycosyltransferase family 1 protein [Roseiflexaceae bacterium]|nr:glycosyltransferase family 1 protein [Roseiflexaceae bacterium]HMP40511.1 glycosyltransferase family 1 protein [Roseiflexaceae bacterium]